MQCACIYFLDILGKMEYPRSHSYETMRGFLLEVAVVSFQQGNYWAILPKLLIVMSRIGEFCLV